jgi:hypothetical protein
MAAFILKDSLLPYKLTPSFMLLAEQCVSDVTSRLKVAVI